MVCKSAAAVEKEKYLWGNFFWIPIVSLIFENIMHLILVIYLYAIKFKQTLRCETTGSFLAIRLIWLESHFHSKKNALKKLTLGCLMKIQLATNKKFSTDARLSG